MRSRLRQTRMGRDAGCKKSKLMRRVGGVCIVNAADTSASTRLDGGNFRRLQDCVEGGGIAQRCRKDPNIIETARLAGCIAECIDWFTDTLDRGLICAAAGADMCGTVTLPPCGAAATSAQAEALAPLAAQVSATPGHAWRAYAPTIAFTCALTTAIV